MNAATELVILGADVSKEWLDLNRFGETEVVRIANERKAIDHFLKSNRSAAIAIEATNRYHDLLVTRARRRGLIVYLISGYELKHYAAAIRRRFRTDPIDAPLLSRYLAHERAQLIPYQPRSPQLQQLWQLLKRRALKAVKGFGPLSCYALLLAYHSGRFIHHDAFVAYLGLDVRAKDSGKHVGKRKLTKHGDGEYRRLLHCAAMTAVRHQPYFKARYAELLARGLAKTAALVVLARKLARLAFQLLSKDLEFDPNRLGASQRT